VKSHAGCIKVESEAGAGTCFSVYFPLAGDAPGKPAPQTDAPAPAAAKLELRVLVVEDEEQVREVITRILKIDGHHCTEAADGAAAVDYYRDHWREVDLVVLDMMMPAMSGEDVLSAMKKINPDVRVTVCSGYTDAGSFAKLRQLGVTSFLDKPFKSAALIGEVHKHYQALQQNG
jgi:CheY-like chemotaxis protein